MIRRPPRSTQSRSSAASDVYKRQVANPWSVPPDTGCPMPGPPSPEVKEAICRVPSASFSQAPWYAQPVHLCRFRVRSNGCLLYTSPSPRDRTRSRMPSSA
eukprot:TRINITY_DN98_c0_g1_i3.p2 TRINITY_DN98_c0_g1~~TRINITY_DN98_c0_g1_i3.p2  ORF type:complete len:101 (+),score=42.24 TRINITY_DN98_c0_g1_i3:132-434(+)